MILILSKSVNKNKKESLMTLLNKSRKINFRTISAIAGYVKVGTKLNSRSIFQKNIMTSILKLCGFILVLKIGDPYQ